MNRTELIAHVARETRLSSDDAAAAVSAVIDAIVDSVAVGQAVTLTGLGTFERRQRAARTGRNPRSGEPMSIAAVTTPAFKAAAPFKRRVSGH